MHSQVVYSLFRNFQQILLPPPQLLFLPSAYVEMESGKMHVLIFYSDSWTAVYEASLAFDCNLKLYFKTWPLALVCFFLVHIHYVFWLFAHLSMQMQAASSEPSTTCGSISLALQWVDRKLDCWMQQMMTLACILTVHALGVEHSSFDAQKVHSHAHRMPTEQW